MHGAQNLRIQAIDTFTCGSPIDREGFWIYKMKTLRPLGLNSDDLFGATQQQPRHRKR